MSDQEYTSAELEALQGNAGERDNTPELTDAEQRYFENHGNVSDTDAEQLNREHGLSRQTEYERDPEPSLQVRELFERIVNHANEQTVRAERLDVRNQTLMDAMLPEPQQQGHAWEGPQERPDPDHNIFATMEHDHQRIARLEQMISQGQRGIEAQRRDQPEMNFYRQSMDRRSAADPEFFNGYQAWLASRYDELMSRRYPNATPDQVRTAVRQGRLPQDLVQHVQAEERRLYRDAIARGVDPADHIEAHMVGRGWVRGSVRAYQAEQHRQAQARQRAAVRQAEQAEEDWFQRVARRIAAAPGVGYEDALRDVLPNRSDRQRYREIKARRQERSWPGSTNVIQRGAW
jgi:hypothetical protein